MKVLRAYNAGSERILSPRLVVVDAAREPSEVRKILVKGLPAQARNGIWLINLETVPTLRPESALDLIYLDQERRVLHAVEISQDNKIEPFKGQSASLLILPPRTIARSKTFTGDPVTIDQIENQSSEYIQPSTSDLAEDRFEPRRAIAPVPSVPPPAITAAPSKTEQPLVTHSFPANKVESLQPTESPLPRPVLVEFNPQSVAKSNSQRVIRDAQRPEPTTSGPDLVERDRVYRVSQRIRSLLSRAEKIDPRMRRAPRFNAPGYVAYYFAGGPSTPHEIRNISAVGFYMVTDERWMVGTVIRVTLQKAENDAKDPSGITALARVVRWDSDGGGFEFVFPERND